MPETTSQPAAETLEEIAVRLVELSQHTIVDGELEQAILSALRSRDERAAKIADKEAARSSEQWKAAYKRNDSSPMKVYNGRRLAAEDIACAIREGK